jgi:hypothetical protein
MFIFNDSWDQKSKSICTKAIDRHGGWSAWENLGAVRIKPLWLRGLLPSIKGYPKTFKLPEYFEVYAKKRRTIFHEFLASGCLGIFDHGNLEIRKSENILSSIGQARRNYHGISKIKFWQPVDCLYFFGYAWITYLSSPFIFPELKLLKSFKHHEGDQVWDALVLQFPADFDAHSRQQTFYFDETGLLRRNDYHADIVGRWAMGAHYSEGYKKVEGIEVALKRRVYIRFGTLSLPIEALAADLEIL